MDDLVKNCPLCMGKSVCVYKQLPGYMEGLFFSVYECEVCDTTYVDPLKTDEQIYEYIYKNATEIPCYESYLRYASLVKQYWNPLSLLVNTESIYWGVREALLQSFSTRKDISVLDVGSGLGYFTYALNCAGYNALGLDISQEAVDRAISLYGNHYRQGNLLEISKCSTEKYDCVLMLELVEHVEDPKELINAALSILKPGGKLILTTPNKTTAPRPVIWQSEFPPVHLWFFSEQSIEKISHSLGAHCTFVDFTKYLKKFYLPGYCTSLEDITSGLPRLTKDGEVYPGHGASMIKTKYLGAWGRYILSYIKRRLKKKTISKQTTTMCAIMSFDM